MKKISALLLVTLLATSCASYRLGSMLPPEIKTVHVPTFINQTREPQIETETTQKTIQEIQKDGSLKIAARENADTLLTVTLKGYTLDSIRYDRDNATQTKSYRLRLTADVLLTDARTGKVIAERPNVRGQTVFEVLGDLTSSKLLALPDAARDLAHNIVETCVEVW